MSVRISRQHWDGLLAELDQARRQRHLLTYRALLERLQLPSPAMLTLTLFTMVFSPFFLYLYGARPFVLHFTGIWHRSR